MEKTITIVRSGIKTELLRDVPDIYMIAEQANIALSKLREGLPTWVSKEVYEKMDISLWIYNDLQVNAFCYDTGNCNYIALSVGLFFEFWKVIEEFANHEKLSTIFKICEEKKPDFMEMFFFYMLNFTIAHEFGHIVHGHLKDGSGKNTIDEMRMDFDKGKSKEGNWLTQLKEYDADTFAVMIQTLLFLQQWKDDDIEENRAIFDKFYLANYLCFLAFAQKTGRSFELYFSKELDEYDHPHPGIRLYYSYLWYSFLIGSVKGENYDIFSVISSGSHAVVLYERQVLEKEHLKDCYYTVAYTQKGAQHVMNLNNQWQELIDFYNTFAYVPIQKYGFIESMPITLDEEGNILENK